MFALYFLIILFAITLWFMCSFGYRILGQYLYRIFKDSKDAMLDDEEDNKLND